MNIKEFKKIIEMTVVPDKNISLPGCNVPLCRLITSDKRWYFRLSDKYQLKLRWNQNNKFRVSLHKRNDRFQLVFCKNFVTLEQLLNAINIFDENQNISEFIFNIESTNDY